MDVAGSRLNACEAIRSIEADNGGVQHIGDLIHDFGRGCQLTFLLFSLRLDRRCRIATLCSNLLHVVLEVLHKVVPFVVRDSRLEQHLGEACRRVGVRADDMSTDVTTDYSGVCCADGCIGKNDARRLLSNK